MDNSEAAAELEEERRQIEQSITDLTGQRDALRAQRDALELDPKVDRYLVLQDKQRIQYEEYAKHCVPADDEPEETEEPDEPEAPGELDLPSEAG
jgi:hypothetical protein